MIQSLWLPKTLRVICALVVLGTWLLMDRADANTFVRLDYNLFSTTLLYQESVFIELFDDRPITRDNFLQYVDAGLYDETIMHRLVPNFVLQGGGFYEDRVAMPAPLNVRLAEDEVDLDGNPATDNPTIMNEFGNLPFRSNARGTLAMAKVGGNPNSATNQFFFNLQNNAGTSPNGLDFQNGGFTVFARVVGNGMSLIDAFGTLQRTSLNNDLITQTVGGAFVSNNPDNIRDFGNFGGPFGDVPFVGGAILRLERAKRTDYYSTTSNTNITASNLTLTNSLGFVEAGASFTGTGKFIVGAGKTLSLNHNAVVDRPVEVAGTLDIGSQIGLARVNNYTQLSTGKLEVQIAGETLYDLLLVSTTANISGHLSVSMLGSFKPSAGDTFILINATNLLTGNFTTASLPTLRPGLAWDIQKTPGTIDLVVLPDYNSNGSVDQGDLTLWQNNYGSTTNLLADGNDDGKVDGRDFLLWQRYFGESSTLPPAPAIMAVPEPSAIALAILGCLATCSRRRTC